jgi:hypothetical protein
VGCAWQAASEIAVMNIMHMKKRKFFIFLLLQKFVWMRQKPQKIGMFRLDQALLVIGHCHLLKVESTGLLF